MTKPWSPLRLGVAAVSEPGVVSEAAVAAGEEGFVGALTEPGRGAESAGGETRHPRCRRCCSLLRRKRG